ncbi:MAG: nucleotide sugar dehydrogenase [Acidimicrobiia bacterium]
MTVAVIGLGKIGLPLAVQFAGAGNEVVGMDTDPAVVVSVNSGDPSFPGEPGLRDGLRAAINAGVFAATVSADEAVAGATTVVVAVPLVIDDRQEPLFDQLDSATDAIGSAIHAGTLVSYETTLPVGTTRRLAADLAETSGLELGVDLFVCHSPERVSSGSVFADLRRYPKLVGGVDAASGARATAFFQSVLTFDTRSDLARPSGVWDLGSSEATELTKLMEVIYRDVNIALSNEFAVAAQRLDLDIERLIEAANSQPFSHLHSPGIAVGGHCVPVYPHLYLFGEPDARLPRAARAVNDAMPEYGARLLEEALGGLMERRVAVLGLAYRGGVKESAFSGTGPLVEALSARGANVAVHDPLYTSEEIRAAGFEPYALGERCDAAVVHTDHTQYAELGPADLPGIAALVDGRRLTDPENWPNVTWRAIGGGSHAPG